MSKSIDGGTVKVNFDNREFNSNVDESTHKINNFKDTIVSLPSDIGNGLSNILSRFNLSDVLGIAATLSGIGLVKEGIQEISSVIEAVAGTAAQIVDSAFDKVYHGGMERALNIEQARFQLKGLGLDVETFMKAANYAVEGTAYGLDSAAKAAAQLGASGVTELEALKQALRGISGVASMTNSTYDEMAYIFTSVAGTGRVMARQLDSIAFRGLNARAALAKYLGKTEEEIRQMTSDGAIDFATFAAAMDNAFGEHAKDANETFSGSLDNIEAALRRIGEAFWNPVIANSVDLFNAIRIALVNFKKELEDNDVYNNFTDSAGIVIQRLKDFVKWIDTALQESELIKALSVFANDIFKTIVDISKITVGSKFMGWTKNIFNNVSILVTKVNDLYLAFQNAFNAVYGVSKYGVFENLLMDASELLKTLEKFDMYDLEPVFKSWFETLHEVFVVFKDILGINKQSIADSFQKAVKAVFEFFKKLKITDEELEKIKNIAKGFASAIDIVFMLVKAIFGFVKPIGSEVRPLADDVLSIGENIANWVTDLRNSIKEGDVFVKFFEKVSTVVAKVKEVIEGVKINFFDAFFGDKESNEDKTFVDRVVTFVKGVIKTIEKAFGILSNTEEIDFSPIQTLINNLSNYGKEGNTSRVDKFIEHIKTFFGSIYLAFEWIEEKFNKIKEPLNSFNGWLGDLIESSLEHVGNIIETFNKFITSKVADGSIDKEVILFVVAKVSEIILSIINLFNNIRRTLEKMPAIVAGTGLLVTVTNGLGTIFNIIKTINGILNSTNPEKIVKSVLSKIEKLEEGIINIKQGKETFSKVIKSLAWFIISIAAALFIISLIPTKDLVKSIIAFASIISIMGLLLGVITFLTGKWQTFTTVTRELNQRTELFKNTKATEKAVGTLAEISKAIRAMAVAVLLIGISLSLVSKSISGLEDPNTIWAVMGTISILLTICSAILLGFAAFTAKRPDIKLEDFLFIGSSIAVLALSTLLIASALKTVASIGNSDAIILSAIVITGIFAVVSAILFGIGAFASKNPKAIEGMIAGAVSVFLALLPLTLVIKAFSKAIESAKDVDWGAILAVSAGIAIVVGAVGGIIALLASLSAVSDAALPVILSFDLALLLIAAIIAAMGLLVKSIKDLFETLFKLFEYDESDVKKALGNLGMLLLGLATICEDWLPAVVASLIKAGIKVLPLIEAFFQKYFVPSVVRVIANSIAVISAEIGVSLTKILLGLATFSPQFKEEAKNLVNEFVFGIGTEKEGALDIILQWISELVDRIHDYINDNTDTWVSNIFETTITLLASVADKLDQNKDIITEKLTTIIRSLILIICNTIRGVETDEEVTQAAHDAIQYLIDGVKDMVGDFGSTMGELAKTGVQSFLDGLDGFSIWDAIIGAFNKEDLEGDVDITPVLGPGSLKNRHGIRSKFDFDNGFSIGGKNISEAFKNVGNSIKDTSINMDELSDAITNGVVSGLKDTNPGKSTLPGASVKLNFNGYETQKVLKGTILEQTLGGYAGFND